VLTPSQTRRTRAGLAIEMELARAHERSNSTRSVAPRNSGESANHALGLIFWPVSGLTSGVVANSDRAAFP